MPRTPLTPEEKLFAIIQKGGGADPSGAGRGRHPSARSAARRAVRLLGWLRAAATDLKQLNRLLLGAVAALALIGIVAPWVGRPDVSRIVAEASQSPVPLVIPPPLENLAPVEEHEALLREHNPFGLRPDVPPAPPPPEPVASTPPDEQLLREEFRLVGIVWAEEPIAMIEQVSTGRTYPVKATEPLGKFTVKSVLKDRVVFEINGQELELF